MTRTLALCADDYGQSAAIDRGILRLAARGRLTAVSCLVGAPGWPAAARALAALPAVAQGRVRVGLHFNLTEGRALSPALRRAWPELPRLPRLIALAHLRLLPRRALRDELQAQWLAFEQDFGRAPDHLDGHQHVHHLPQVRALVLELLHARSRVTVRHTGHVRGPGFNVKRALIERSGGRALGQRLEALGRQANAQLFGVYDFAARDYRPLMQAWLKALPGHGGLVFCHPGEADSAAESAATAVDPIATARVRELAYFDSDAFLDDLVEAEVRLG